MIFSQKQKAICVGFCLGIKRHNSGRLKKGPKCRMKRQCTLNILETLSRFAIQSMIKPKSFKKHSDRYIVKCIGPIVCDQTLSGHHWNVKTLQ